MQPRSFKQQRPVNDGAGRHSVPQLTLENRAVALCLTHEFGWGTVVPTESGGVGLRPAGHWNPATGRPPGNAARRARAGSLPELEEGSMKGFRWCFSRRAARAVAALGGA